MNRAIFLDRDGVLNQPIIRSGLPYPPHSISEFRLYPEVPEACSLLRRKGYLLVVVTNQPDIGRGTQSQQGLEEIHKRLGQAIPLDRIEACTAANDSAPESARRKPAPGMVLDAAKALNIDLSCSYIIGDRWRDIDCGYNAGCMTIFIDRGYAESLRQPPHFRVTNLLEAANLILSLEHANLPFTQPAELLF